MLGNFIQKLLKRDKNALIIRKTDDEVTRYLKQTKIQSERKRYSDIIKQETQRKEMGLNVDEKRMHNRSKIDSLKSQIYDKRGYNDSFVNFDHLTAKQNFNPHKKWFFTYPLYSKFSDIGPKLGPHHYFLRIIGSLILMKIGWEIGLSES